jgi:transposase
MIAVCRLRCCPKTRAYAQRRTTEGKTKKEIIRCLKRDIAREVYNSLRADLRPLTPT